MDRNVIVIVGAHNSGKTTFIEKVVSILSEEGVKVAYIKHDPKGKAKTDTEGKDSYRIYNAGATEVIVASPNKISHFKKVQDYTLEDLIKSVDPKIDIIIVEGFKTAKNFKKFEVIRKQENRDLMLKDDLDLVGVITDYYDFPLRFDINNPKEFIDYLKSSILEAK
ncbi:MAG: molybdopterin-guanine dinucleotide biosynthesis protein B [Sulfurihydrogenibium sp.]|jgi:molybdopterin-guanine dinucleotide biosynthesis protein B|nr:molybdopterin-guanine dinucleotide biosynthesis protein B [Sulfurihydrogenibium sp.]